jgi:hypothetical protein
VEHSIELTVAGPVEAMPVGQSGRRRDRRCAAEAGERGLVATTARVRPCAQDGCRHDRADAALVEKVGPPSANDGEDLAFVAGSFALETPGSLCDAAQCSGDDAALEIPSPIDT